MKALVIGGGGFIGESLTDALARDGFELIVCCRNRRPTCAAAYPDRVRLVDVTLEDTAAIGRLLDVDRPDMVIHLASDLTPASDAAAYMEEGRLVRDPSLRLMLLLAERRTRLVYFSSGGTVYGKTSEPMLYEASPCRPISFYGHAKLEMENLIRFMHRTTGLPYLILRPSNPFGGSQSLRGRQGLIAVILGCLVDGKPLEVWGGGEAIRDYIYIDDLCASVRHLIRAGVMDDTVNVGSGVGHTLIDVVRAVEHVVSRNVVIDFREARPVDVPRVVLDIAKSTRLGSPPARPLIEGIRAFAATLGGFGA